MQLDLAATNRTLADELQLSLVRNISELTEQLAIFEQPAEQLILNLLLDGKPQRLAFSLDDGELANRAAKVSKTNELIAKAIGCKPHFRPKVLDATAGMGRDSLIMLMLGCEVVMQERNPAIFKLLKNAVERLAKNQQFDQSIFQRLELKQSNSVRSLGESKGVQVIYLDPMFPQRKKSALVKKEMRLFKRIAGDDLDADQLLEAALECDVPRVVVKRPKGAESLAGRNPSHQITGKKFRFDVYIK